MLPFPVFIFEQERAEEKMWWTMSLSGPQSTLNCRLSTRLAEDERKSLAAVAPARRGGANRPIPELESTPTHRKQTPRPRSNRPISRNSPRACSQGGRLGLQPQRYNTRHARLPSEPILLRPSRESQRLTAFSPAPCIPALKKKQRANKGLTATTPNSKIAAISSKQTTSQKLTATKTPLPARGAFASVNGPQGEKLR
jgi:hypothetical protein